MDIPEVEWDAAVSYLVQHVSNETWSHIQRAIEHKGPKWYVGEGQRLGKAVRYLLTQGGFRWGAVCIQANWFRLLEDGAKRVFFVKIEVSPKDP
jgi:anaerobic selenocysteine-containing dehydrogenase